jgi:anhydro-N-acetylmuramic acid kinase
MQRKVVGCMTGTSMDGLDVCLMQIDGQGFDMKVKILAQGSFGLEAFRDRFQKISNSQSINLSDYLQAALDFGKFHASSISSVIKKLRIDLICVHGQTLFHKPPLSLQLLNPYPIASSLKTPVVYDLRGMDLACGGEGAPITPIADQILYQIKRPTAILNFGGFCNYTFIQPKNAKLEVTGGDICACNLFLNQLSKLLFENHLMKMAN